jgi:hypothetical protein
VSSGNIEIILTATDEASAKLEQAGRNIDDVLFDIEGSTRGAEAAMDKLDSTQVKVSSETEKLGTSLQRNGSTAKDSIVAFSGLVTSAFALYEGFDRIEKATVAADRANLNVVRSTENVDQAQKALAESTAKYGEDSVQAKDAADKLAIAQEALAVSTERAGIAQNQVKETMISSALMVIPTLITMINSVGGVTKVWTGIQAALNAVMDANPIAIVVIAIAALVAAVVAAYSYCKPFKDAVDAVGKALGEYLAKAIEVIKGALEWLWNNILVPLGNFLIGQFMGAIKAIGDALGWLGGVLKPIGDAFGWLANTIGGAIKAAGAAIDDYNAKVRAMEESSKNGLSIMQNYYNDKFAEMSSTVDAELAKQVEVISAKTWEAVNAQQASYDEDMKNFVAYWNTKFGETTTELDKIDAKINDYYDKQVKDVQAAYQKQIDAAQAAYDKELSDFSSFWETKFGTQTSELSQVQDAITSHYDKEISDTQESYNTLIDQCNNYYDNLKAATNAGLAAIRADRQADLDALELEYLKKREFLESQNAAGLLSEKDYNDQISEIQKTYNDTRSSISQDYRIKELEAEKTSKEAATVIELERSVALADIKTKEAAAVTQIESQKNADLQTAQTQYNQITQTDFQALTEAIKSLKSDEAKEVTAIESQKNADLKAAAIGYTTLIANNAREQTKIQIDKANAIAAAEQAAAEQKKAMLLTLEAEINANTSLSADEKKRIMADMNASILSDTQSSWNNIAGTIQSAMDTITQQNAVFKQALEDGKISASQYAEAMAYQNKQAADLQAQATINSQNAVFAQALSQGKITQAQYNQAMAIQNANMAKYGSGGIAMEKQIALVAENEPEAIIPLSKLRSMPSAANEQNVTQNITMYPVINVYNPQSNLDIVESANEGMSEALRRQQY